MHYAILALSAHVPLMVPPNRTAAVAPSWNSYARFEDRHWLISRSKCVETSQPETSTRFTSQCPLLRPRAEASREKHDPVARTWVPKPTPMCDHTGARIDRDLPASSRKRADQRVTQGSGDHEEHENPCLSGRPVTLSIYPVLMLV